MPAEAAPSWLYAPALPAPGEPLPLTSEDRHYLIRVCRARAGESAVATDGRGGVARLRLEPDGESLLARVEDREQRKREREAWLLCGSPETDRGDWLVEKVAELGIAVFQPIDCTRGKWSGVARRRDRWHRLAVAALRQSRRPFLLEIREPLPLGEALAALPEAGSRWLADPAGPRGRSASAGESPAQAAVGPAGGFDEREWALLQDHDFQPIGLSDSRLRTETAALAWAAWWAAG